MTERTDKPVVDPSSPTWTIVSDWANGEIERLKEHLATTKFETLDQVTDVQGQITALVDLLNLEDTKQQPLAHL